MPIEVAQVTQDAMALVADERAHLAHVLLQSLDEEDQSVGLEEAWNAEMARRVAKVLDGSAQSRSAEEVFRDLRNRLAE